ncbi:hypothetical protein CCAX7_55020 [Capsulimonas corticalis]|uniref:Uncharacterized protein n=1 Tax=Capsulimonas corticalis TaxID=2219043 RepID=A0A402D5R0_9BACT|nr:hypothetical protein [Capsulimonas corticalis]BDI33451.1 hypothetical protein CCAX7_55020 [Capsulimonas corticalis]
MIAALYTDGGVIRKNPSLIGGTWAWAQVDASGERIHSECGVVKPFMKDELGFYLPVTNNNTEMIALTKGLLSLPEGWSGTVYCDSKIALGWTFWEYNAENVPAPLIAKARLAVTRLGQIETVLLDGHPTAAHLAANKGKRGGPVSVHNQHCDEECGRIGREYLLANGDLLEAMGLKPEATRDTVRKRRVLTAVASTDMT